MTGTRPVKVAILWHMHQPNYSDPQTGNLLLPWVRLHATKDYLDMPLMAAADERVRVTFNLVPSLLDQLQVYTTGGSDRHLDLSRKSAEELDDASRLEILESFFYGHPETMIHPYPRLSELYRKHLGSVGDTIQIKLFSSEELRDIQVWSNLVWVDPMFRDQEPVKHLLSKGRHFTEEEKHALLDWQLSTIKEVLPTYQRLLKDDLIDLSFTPYYHPILPLLCDTDIAKEALPSIDLPAKRFIHPEDAEKQIRMSMDKYESLFGIKMTGMWPSEGSVSEEMAGICMKLGLQWIATDEEVLYRSLVKSQLDRRENPQHALYEYGPGLKMFFRDHALSDRIGFVYSGWDAERSADDFLNYLKHIGNLYSNKDELVVPVILDGENAWEYFKNDGRDFLTCLYSRLAVDKDIETVTFKEAVEQVTPRVLPSIFAGSWINHNFRIWIGHPEDNRAWDLLAETRDFLVSQIDSNTQLSEEAIEKAWKQIYIAEGSDWCWWYGDEHRGSQNEEFDRIFRGHLEAVYKILDVEPPLTLRNPIYREGVKATVIQPDSLISPKIDGRLSHFYEWSGAGNYLCGQEGGAMHRIDSSIQQIYFGYDHERFYIRLDIDIEKVIDSAQAPLVVVQISAGKAVQLDIPVGKNPVADEMTKGYVYAIGNNIEVAVDRTLLWEDEYGELELLVKLHDDNIELESWPTEAPIKVEVYKRNNELFWPSS